LFQPIAAGALSLRNRIAMGPMTRSRAIDNVPTEVMRDYYRQRNGAGLVITEGTSPSAEGLGYARIPGLFTQQQAQAWAGIADAVHEGGAKLVVQLMHSGRIGHRANLPAGTTLVGPSAIRAAGQVWTDAEGMQPNDLPKAMDAEDLIRVRGDFVRAARLAVDVGIDGVELHAANGYLLAQFLNPQSNQRSDRYGGSAANRQRFLLEVVDAVVAEIGAGRVGVRLSPFTAFNDLAADYPGEHEQTLSLATALAARGIGYLHLITTPVPEATVRGVRAAFPGTLVLAGDFDRERAEAALAEGRADVVAFARGFIANPDLPERMRQDRPLAAFDAATRYSVGAQGYSDYPDFQDEPPQVA
jgi:N-ethylmaleimide reductase